MGFISIIKSLLGIGGPCHSDKQVEPKNINDATFHGGLGNNIHDDNDESSATGCQEYLSPTKCV